MRIFDENGDVLAIFYSVKRKGGQLVIDAKVLDSLRVDMVVRPGEIPGMLKLVFSWAVISFVFMLPYFGIKSLFSKGKKKIEK
ncbi:MAG: hypothetical protein Q7R34_14180 [Dehalococcoidia bacterium]|nr:hypothetical protein [Dehalococcoidia bacterium]